MPKLSPAAIAALPVALLDPACVWSPDRNEQALRVLESIQDKASEWGGVIYKNAKGEYCYSAPVTNNKKNDVQYRARKGTDYSIDSLYHTHPDRTGTIDGDTTELFSSGDVDQAKALARLSYMRSMSTGDTRLFDPKKSQTQPTQESGVMPGSPKRNSAGSLITAKIIERLRKTGE
jgi:hypothetical protein